MVQGPRAKTRKTPSVQLDYIIQIQEIKPWPPSQSLRAIRGALIQWENGDRNSGSTSQVVPSVGADAGVGDGKIEFNESFRLTVMLLREKLIKGGNGYSFQKNCIEFNLYEPRRDKAGQLLGTAVVDLAECGIIKDSLCISAPINCKRTYGNTAQPLLFLKIQHFEKGRRSSSSRMTREPSLERSNSESTSALGEDYAEEADVASFTTDDDASSHSSLAVASAAADSNGSSSPQNKDNGAVAMNDRAGELKLDEDQATQYREKPADLSSDLAWISNKILSRSLQYSPEEIAKQLNSSNKVDEHENEAVCTKQDVSSGGSNVRVQLNSSQGTIASAEEYDNVDSVISYKQDGYNASSEDQETGQISSPQNSFRDDEIIEGRNHKYTKETKIVEKKEHYPQIDLVNGFSEVELQKRLDRENGLPSATEENFAYNNNNSSLDRLKHVKSVRSLSDSSKSNGPVRSNQFLVADAQNHSRVSKSCESKESKTCKKEINKPFSDGRIQHLEHRMKVLEEELREAAAIEVSLYSVVAEHGSSMTKVHAPARRLSRLYFHVSKLNSKSRRGSAAKSIVSGLVLVSKACGNDVPRLTFWLSNSIVLRVIVRKFFKGSKFPTSVDSVTGKEGNNSGKRNSLPLKWDSFPSISARSDNEESFGNWEEPSTFVTALEKVEAWIFGRIIESIWWQTFTPHMQSDTAKEISSSEQQVGSFSLELWRNAFRDACERICPVRAGGHECGCLPVLSKVIMEQLIARLDVAMFNAILRESADDIPTDPVADPISDADVLPIPAGKASFGAGAQLKVAIGNWSRWLTDIFGVDEDEANSESENAVDDDERISNDTSSKCFHLLNALSDLMMLPKDLLLSQTVRKEVCPTFGAPLIRRVLNFFIPDEFCPDPIPAVVLEALNSEDPFDSEGGSIMNFPCSAVPIAYHSPSASSVTSFLGEIESHPQLTRSRSSVLRKSQTSDDELDELDSPLKSIISEASPSSAKNGWTLKENESRNPLRYQLLRDVWMDCD